MTKQRQFLLVIAILFGWTVSAQIVIKGTVVDKQGESLDGISLLLHPLGNANKLLGYAISDKGTFSIEIKQWTDSLAVTATSLSYANKTVLVPDSKTPIVLQLTPEAKQLKEVVIEAHKIRRKGDTLSYRVGGFAHKNDRSIGDVINRMPGFEVSESGRIEYQGKAIQKYYIEGLDLLEGRYGLANKNLPHKSVASVEVLENHQPIRMLDSLVFSDATSLNIKLKNNIAVTGTAKLGIGASPLLWKVNITPMFFSKKQQAIASYQTNNIGEDLSTQLMPLGTTIIIGNNYSPEKKRLVGIRELSAPPIAQNRYWDNNVHLLTYNHLASIKKGTDLKINASYLNDYLQQQGATILSYFMGNHTLTVTENIHNRRFNNGVKMSVILDQNLSHRYLKNKMTITKHWDSEQGLVTDKILHKQYANTPTFSLQNNLEWLQRYGHKFIKVKSDISYNNAPQYLDLSPGVFANILNKNKDYEQTRQSISEETFLAKNNVGFSINKRLWHFDTEIGLDIEKRHQKSDIYVNENILKTDSLRNNLKWLGLTTYVKEKIRYEHNNWYLSLNLPIKGIMNTMKDRNYKQDKNYLTFEPSFRLNHLINGFWRWSVGAGYGDRIGSIENIYYGYRLQGYRSLSRRSVPLKRTKQISQSARLEYKNPISGFFANINYYGSFRKNNIIYKTQINKDGTMAYYALEKDNSAYTHGFTLSSSKIFPKAGVTVFANLSYNIGEQESFYQNNLFTSQFHSFRFNPRLNFALFNAWAVEYDYMYSKSLQESRIVESVLRKQVHKLLFYWYITDNQTLTLGAEDYISETESRRNETPFMNLSYHYALKKYRLDFGLECINLLNRSYFVNNYITDISNIHSEYKLRPRQFVFSVRMSLGGK